EDQGVYTVIIDNKQQPLVQLKVIPKPVTRQTMDIPQTTFNEGETLTIKCQFDSAPEETFQFFRNEISLIPNDRISTTVKNNTYIIEVKNLKPKEDEGVYTLKSEHLILDTPSITVIPRIKSEKPKDTENVVEEIEEETITIDANKKPETIDIEVTEKEEDQLPEITATVTKKEETTIEETSRIETSVDVEKAVPIQSPTITEIVEEQENIVEETKVTKPVQEEKLTITEIVEQNVSTPTVETTIEEKTDTETIEEHPTEQVKRKEETETKIVEEIKTEKITEEIPTDQPTIITEETTSTVTEEEKPKPVEEEKPKPVEEEKPKPVAEEQPKPVEEEIVQQPVDEQPKPAEEEKPKPVEVEKPKPVEEEKPKPTEEEKPKPVEVEKPKPVEEEKPKPVEEEKPKPVEVEKPKPVEEEKPKLVEEEKPKPVEEKPKPAEDEKPKPVEEQPKPVEEEKPKPVEEEKPKPTEEEKPKPVEEEKPKPVEEEKPKPVEEEKSKPVEEQPKPAEEEKPKPVEEEKPKPVEEQPKPVEEEKPKPVEEEQVKVVEEEKTKLVEQEQPKVVQEETPKPAEIEQTQIPEEQTTTVETTVTEQIEEEPTKTEKPKEEAKLEVSQIDETLSVEEEKPFEEKKEVTTIETQLEENIEQEIPIHEVEENSTVTLTVDRPSRDIILLKDNERVKPSNHIQITQTSTTTTEIQINKAKPEDQGVYTVIIDNKQQPLVQLKVIPKPVTRQTMDIPQTTFNEGETLTIKCQFDSAPEETFQFFRNEISLIPNDRISTTVKNNTYIIEVKNLKPKEDEGVYTLRSEHLILDTPSITVIPRIKSERPKDTENVVEEIEEETITIDANKKPETIDIEVTEKEEDQLPEVTTTVTKKEETSTIETSVDVEKAAPVESPTITEIVEEEKAPIEEKKKPIPQTIEATKTEETVSTEEIPQAEQTTTEVVEETVVVEQPQPTKKKIAGLPVQEVEEMSTVTLTIEKPQNTTTKDVVLLKNGEELKPSDHVKIKSISPTTTEVNITKVKREDEGDYTVEVKGVEQPLVRLIVHPKPVVRQEMQLPKTQFNEKETLTIVCQFDATPEEPFILLHNDKPIVADSRITTTVEDNKYTIVVKDLRPEEDEGVYTLKSDHLILDTPSISIVPEEKKSQTETVTIEEIVTVVPQEEQPRTVTQQEEEVTEITEKKQPQEQIESPIQEVEETTTVTMTVELPQGTSHKDIILLKDNERVKPSNHIQITQTSTTTTEIQINKAKPEDQGVYTVIIDNKQQPLVQLKVIPKPVTRQTMDIPQTTFNEGETLTIKCQFDSAPEETFQFFRNEISLIPNDRISTTVKNNTYIIE
ncbi:unnamed protein product, partial [Adineta steineri]